MVAYRIVAKQNVMAFHPTRCTEGCEISSHDPVRTTFEWFPAMADKVAWLKMCCFTAKQQGGEVVNCPVKLDNAKRLTMHSERVATTRRTCQFQFSNISCVYLSLLFQNTAKPLQNPTDGPKPTNRALQRTSYESKDVAEEEAEVERRAAERQEATQSRRTSREQVYTYRTTAEAEEGVREREDVKYLTPIKNVKKG